VVRRSILQDAPVSQAPDERAASPDGDRSLRSLAKLFLRLGLTAFGGPAAHIALFRHEVVERRRWLSDQGFLDMLGTASVLPGPTSTEVAIAIGQARAGWRGMLVSGGLFMIPSTLIVLLLAVVYQRLGSVPPVDWILYGIQPVVIGVVAHALLALAPSAVRDLATAIVAAGTVAFTLLGWDPLLVLAGGAAALLLMRGLALAAGRGVAGAVAGMTPLGHAAHAPELAVAGAVGLGALFVTFLKIGLLVFGSGYVLIAFLRADFVEPGLLTDRQLLDAVAIGQVTPGPVFSAATFIGYLLAGVPGAVVATVAVFAPSFLLVGLVHPLVPRMRSSPALSALLDGVNAAALGLMAAVTVELGRSAIVDVVTAAITLASLVVLLRWRLNPVWLLAVGGLAGVALGVSGAI
jgi:chromate transporter